MRIQHVLAFAAAATLSLSALADPAIPPASNPANVVTIEAGNHAAFRLAPGEAQHMKGAFQLDDGRMLVLSNSGNRLYAELDGKREQLVPKGQNRFLARSTGTMLTFDRVPFANDVVVSNAR